MTRSTKTNAAAIADLAPSADVSALNTPTFIGDEPTNPADMIEEAMELIASAFYLPVNIPHPDGDREVEFVSDEQTGEVELVRCKVVNRYGKQQRGMLNQVLRQLDYSVESGLKEMSEIADKVANAQRNRQGKQDTSALDGFIEKQLAWSDVIADQVSHAQSLRARAFDTYLALTGQIYTPYEKKEPRKVEVAAPAAAAVDPRLARLKEMTGR